MCRLSCAKPELLTLASAPLQADLLGTAAGIIGDAQRRSPRACRFGGKRDAEGATRPCLQAGATVVSLSKISATGPGNRNTGDVQRPGALVRERYFLLRAGGADLLLGEIEVRRGQAGRGRVHGLGDRRRSAASEVGIAAVARRQRPGPRRAEGQRAASRPGAEGTVATPARAGIHRHGSSRRSAPGHAESHRHRLLEGWGTLRVAGSGGWGVVGGGGLRAWAVARPACAAGLDGLGGRARWLFGASRWGGRPPAPSRR